MTVHCLTLTKTDQTNGPSHKSRQTESNRFSNKIKRESSEKRDVYDYENWSEKRSKGVREGIPLARRKKRAFPKMFEFFRPGSMEISLTHDGCKRHHLQSAPASYTCSSASVCVCV